jgi:NhaA family Na+:H+ antiporter
MPHNALPQVRPDSETPISVLTSPFVRFARMEAAGGILLLIATAVALVWANSPWEQVYHDLWHAEVAVGLGSKVMTETRHLWINDGLMAVFFFLVGLEIKREILIGELASFKQAAFPFMAALGGTVFPALIYFSVNRGTEAIRGWGIPMATDIAFALGVLALLGSRVPVGLKVFVAALAIIDDIFAVLVIALFYTDHISFVGVAVAAVGLALSCAANWAGIRKPGVYALIGVFVWLAVLKSGVHATIAGVLLAFTIPANTFIDRDSFLQECRGLLDRFAAAEADSAEAHAAVHSLELQCELVESPLQRIEHGLQPWVGFVIMPIFALANAGVHVLGNLRAAATHPVALGVLFGLFVGKPLGITVFSWLAARTGIAAAPEGVNWRQLFGAAWLCGIGFTMSLFVATLAFGTSYELDVAKIGIIAASLFAGVAGSAVILREKGKAAQA